MKRLSEVLKSVLMRERSLEDFEKEVKTDGTVSFEAHLTKGHEYLIRAHITGNGKLTRGVVRDTDGACIEGYSNKKGTYFTALPEKDGMYRIEATVEGIGREGAVLSANLYESTPPPAFIMHQSVLSVYVADERESEAYEGKREALKALMGEVFGHTRA